MCEDRIKRKITSCGKSDWYCMIGSSSREKERKMTEKLNLYQKLVEIRKAVVYMQKDAQGFKYRYATEGALLEKIRPIMDKLGVFLEVDMPEVTGQKGEYLKATLRFIWVNADNPAERLEKTVVLMDAGDIDVKKVGGLMTYGVKYFLYKFFNVETGNDPDENQEEKEVVEEAKGLGEKQIAYLQSLAEKNPTVGNNILSYCKLQNWGEFANIKISEAQYKSMVNSLKGGK